MPINLTLTEQHFNYLVQVVAQRPYAEAAPIINELHRQAQGQAQPAGKTVLHDQHRKGGNGKQPPAGE